MVPSQRRNLPCYILWLLFLLDVITHAAAFTSSPLLRLRPFPAARQSSRNNPSTDARRWLLIKPAMEHTQPLWGPLDPYLTAGTSIAPPDHLVPNTEGWTEEARSLLSAGVRILDGAALHAERVLPGFTPTGSLLSPPHSAVVMESSSPAVWAATVEWAADFVNIVDKLPLAALAYVMVEFFLLRPGLDLYKEDVEADPTRALTDAVAVTGVRVAMFCVVAVVTVGVFGG